MRHALDVALPEALHDLVERRVRRTRLRVESVRVLPPGLPTPCSALLRALRHSSRLRRGAGMPLPASPAGKNELDSNPNASSFRDPLRATSDVTRNGESDRRGAVPASREERPPTQTARLSPGEGRCSPLLHSSQPKPRKNERHVDSKS